MIRTVIKWHAAKEKEGSTEYPVILNFKIRNRRSLGFMLQPINTYK